jgi:lysophospholipase L1-like esterase
MTSLTAGAALHAARPPRPITIVALGDSLTAGRPYFFSPLESPPDGQGDLEGQFAHWMTRRHPDWTVLNHGIGGQRSDQIRARFDAVLRLQPHYIVILAGTNDIHQGASIRELGKNLDWMVRQAKQRSIMPILVTLPPFDAATSKQTEELTRVNAWIREAAERFRVPWVDAHTALAHPSNPARLTGTDDGVHPDIGGYRTLGRAVAAVIASMEAARP